MQCLSHCAELKEIWLLDCSGTERPCLYGSLRKAEHGKLEEKCKGIVEEGRFATEGVPVENTDYLLSKHQFDRETHAPSQRPPIRLGYSRL
ncbi:uncharacterized [Tachysurus ichikawai]